MRCPKCSSKIHKVRLDVYWCYACNTAWLIHKLTTYKTPEEAADTTHLLSKRQENVVS